MRTCPARRNSIVRPSWYLSLSNPSALISDSHYKQPTINTVDFSLTSHVQCGVRAMLLFCIPLRARRCYCVDGISWGSGSQRSPHEGQGDGIYSVKDETKIPKRNETKPNERHQVKEKSTMTTIKCSCSTARTNLPLQKLIVRSSCWISGLGNSNTF